MSALDYITIRTTNFVVNDSELIGMTKLIHIRDAVHSERRHWILVLLHTVALFSVSISRIPQVMPTRQPSVSTGGRVEVCMSVSLV